MKNLSAFVIGMFAMSISFAQQSDSADYYYKKGLDEKAARRYLVASAHFTKATNFKANFTAAYLENAYMFLEMRKTDQAKAMFMKVYELEPSNISAIKELTDLFFSYRQFQKAIEFAGKCAGCENAQRIIAMSNYQLEDYAAAIKGLLAVLAKKPKDAEVAYTLGRTYLEIEEYKNAIPYYTQAVNLDASRSVWTYELGLLYYNLNDYKNAAIYFNKAAENGYTQGNDFAENLGYAYIYSGEFEKGEKLLLGILAKKPGSKDMLRDIAEAYYQQKLYDKSLDFCRKLLEMDAKDGKALYQAGMCFQKKGQNDRGQAMCDKAIELDPSLMSMRQKRMSAGL
jgi:tetratricopeptide (TPR) repeat protein